MSRTALWIEVLALSVFCSTAESSDRRTGVIVVEAIYPGASAHVIADTVAAPIERQVNGVDKQVQIASRSTEGKYVLTVAFKPGTDLKAALAMVQRRAALAEPTLPELARVVGLTAKIRTPILSIASLSSTNGSHDMPLLSGVAKSSPRRELSLLPGVGEIAVLGGIEERVQVHIDPDRLRARNLTASDVAKALKDWKSAEKSARGDAPDKLRDVSRIEDVVVKTTAEGQVVWMRDVARIELGATGKETVRFNAEPCVALAVFPTFDANAVELSRAVENKLNTLRPSLPAGMKLDLAFDFGANLDRNRVLPAEYLLLELQFPAGVSRDLIARQLSDSVATLRNAPGVKDLLSFTADPFDVFTSHPCILIRLSPPHERKIASEEIARIIDKSLKEPPGLSWRLRSMPRDDGRTFDLAVQGDEPSKSRELAEKFAARLRQSVSEANVVVDNAGVLAPRFEFDVDRGKAKAIGVPVDELAAELEIAVGATTVQIVEAFGRNIRIVVTVEGGALDRSESLRRHFVRNDMGQMVPLGSLVALRTILAPAAVDRINLKPATRISIDALAETTSTKLRRLYEKEFELARRELNLTTGYCLLLTPP